VTILAHLPPDIPLGVEVPMAGATGHEERARRCRDGAGRVLSKVRRLRPAPGPR
jgi:hypothetical protein